MNKILKYIIFMITLCIGIFAVFHGSNLILHTYQLESSHIETLKTGNSLSGEHVKWVEKRGFDEGLFHVLFLIGGVVLSTVSFVLILNYMMSSSRKIKGNASLLTKG